MNSHNVLMKQDWKEAQCSTFYADTLWFIMYDLYHITQLNDVQSINIVLFIYLKLDGDGCLTGVRRRSSVIWNENPQRAAKWQGPWNQNHSNRSQVSVVVVSSKDAKISTKSITYSR